LKYSQASAAARPSHTSDTLPLARTPPSLRPTLPPARRQTVGRQLRLTNLYSSFPLAKEKKPNQETAAHTHQHIARKAAAAAGAVHQHRHVDYAGRLLVWASQHRYFFPLD
jgi:hypothetical protein